MQLIGMLDSPYVRRVAVSLRLMGVPFVHRPLSVFRAVDAFRQINPVVKAPTLVADDGTVLMDSSLILEHAEGLPQKRLSLMPADPQERLAVLRQVGLALAACEKAVQIVYEHELRPAEKQHAPWLERIRAQLLAACEGMEAELARRPREWTGAAVSQADVSTAVAWQFMRQLLPGEIAFDHFARLQRHSAVAEALPAFQAAPHGSGTCA